MKYEISGGYRSSRNLLIIFCGAALAWAAVQFELKFLNVEPFGQLDLSHASIPVLLSVIILFLAARSVIEFTMQSLEVRRWKVAQLDFKIYYYATMLSIFCLGVSSLERSAESLIYASKAVALLGLILFLLFCLVYVVFTFLYIWVWGFFGRRSVAALVMESFAISLALVLTTLMLNIFNSFEYLQSFEISKKAFDFNSSFEFGVLFKVLAMLDVFLFALKERIECYAFSLYPNFRSGVYMICRGKPPSTGDWFETDELKEEEQKFWDPAQFDKYKNKEVGKGFEKDE